METHFNSPALGLKSIYACDSDQHFSQFWESHPDAEHPIKAWVDEVRLAQWTQPWDIKAQYRNASILKNRRVVFNIKGNDYRIVAAIAYRLGIVYVKFIGTHAVYDSIDAETIEME